MKVLFVYLNLTRQEYIPMGIAHLSSFVKARGHTTALLDYTWGGDVNKGLRRVREENPDLIAISTNSGVLGFAVNLARAIKENFDVPIIVGGPHPTVAPQDAINIPYFDMVCIGEGEEVLADVMDRMQDGGALDSLKGLWFKKNGEVVRGATRLLRDNLDEHPFPDRDIFDFERYLKSRNYIVDVITGRGCPYRCTYCINPHLQKLYRGKGKFIRRRSVGNVVKEISLLMQRYRIKGISFHDDVFILSREWLIEFADMYEKEIALPFSCSARPEVINEETISLLKRAGCVSVAIGIESGNERIRREVLHRPVSDETIINAFNLVREAGVGTYSYNIVGIPYETKEDMEMTVELNRKARPSSLQVTIFQPYPGTELRVVAEKEGWIMGGKGVPQSHKFYSIMEYPWLSRREIERARVFFRYKVLKAENLMKALLFLIFDIFFVSYTRFREYIPVSFRNILFRIENFIARG